jgi:soluble cytochrome b562
LISYSGKRTFEGLKEFVDALDAIDTSSEEAAPEAAPKAAEDAHDEL